MRYFTPESANRALPLVRRIAADMVDLYFEVGVRGRRIDSLASPRGLVSPSAHAEELEEMRVSLRADKERLEGFREELSRIGAVVHSPTEGVVDFPAIIEDREVRLCWKPSDEQVSFWHELDESPASRKSIQGVNFGDVFEGDSPSLSRRG